MNCPKCGSNEWRLASLVYAEGTTSVDSKTNTFGGGGGVGTGGAMGGVGGGRSHTTGEHQTNLAQSLAPPKMPRKPNSWWYFGGVFLLFVWLGDNHPYIAFTIVVLAIIAWPGLKKQAMETYERETGLYHDAMSTWEKTKMCQRCGHPYVSEKNTEDKPMRPNWKYETNDLSIPEPSLTTSPEDIKNKGLNPKKPEDLFKPQDKVLDSSLADEFEKLAKLRDKNIISEEEFIASKRKLLGDI